ncbi:S41 family peptidase [Sphingomonas jatrophae]|uniref:Peptidase family S41 n=1 Tax=Sphingomonas jatrophae TaxID=1166337 RepID=A0A1I6L4M9_9SPHN|nr:S41 family peptidase [Sphingomonas jatrophae]SFR98210.1 Peptidase family S41 [Sphingomonas jatrophae]
MKLYSVRRAAIGALSGSALLLSGCGGGGGGGGTSLNGGPTPTPPVSTACSLTERQNWAAAQIREWYLFPETLPASLAPAGYATVDDYIDALTATARAQRRDRYFTYLTSIREEEAFFNSGSSAGFGLRFVTDSAARRLFVSEAFEGAPGLAAGIDRGTEILAIGTTQANLRSVSDIIAAQGTGGISDALGPSTVGTTRVLRVAGTGGSRDVSLTKADFTLTPVSSRYGYRIIDDGGRRVGYLNLRTFISTADPALRTAFQAFKDAGVTQLVIDLRYNGGGLVDTAELLADLIGGGRSSADVLDYTAYRPEKSSQNETRFFSPQPQSVATTRVAFIGTGGTASASELVANTFIPYLRSAAALVGSNTFGKPVGQIALDRSSCDDRLRVVAFATQNSARQGDYFEGLATRMEATCAADDDITRPLGDPQEASLARALDFLAGRGCTRIGTAQSARTAAGTEAAITAGPAPRMLLTPDRPTTVQREVPGSF